MLQNIFRQKPGRGQNIPRVDINQQQDRSSYLNNNLQRHSSTSLSRSDNGNNQHEPINQGDSGDCGHECQNLLYELDHPKEHSRCPNPGQVIDIWGYCRYVSKMSKVAASMVKFGSGLGRAERHL